MRRLLHTRRVLIVELVDFVRVAWDVWLLSYYRLRIWRHLLERLSTLLKRLMRLFSLNDLHPCGLSWWLGRQKVWIRRIDASIRNCKRRLWLPSLRDIILDGLTHLNGPGWRRNEIRPGLLGNSLLLYLNWTRKLIPLELQSRLSSHHRVWPKLRRV